MIFEGVWALHLKCPFDVAFPAGGEEEAVEAVLEAALGVLFPLDAENSQESS